MQFVRIGELVALPLIWGAGVYGAISLKDLQFANEHTICGPWGCGPTSAALITMHVGWLALLAPPMLFLPQRIGLTGNAIRWFSSALTMLGLLGIVAIISWQWLVWMPQAGEWSKPYIWQRCGFAVATAVDFPLLQLVAIGIALRLLHRKPTTDRTQLTATVEVEQIVSPQQKHAAPEMLSD